MSQRETPRNRRSVNRLLIGRSSSRALSALSALLAFGAIVLGAGEASGQVPFEYAVKFVCGVVSPAVGAPPPPVAKGAYFTAINVHNPSREAVKFQKKFAVALPGEKPGKVSKFFETGLQADEAFEIDCPDILKHLDMKGFVKGFAIIQSPRELDVVAVYTAAATATGPVVTMEIERVPKRP